MARDEMKHGLPQGAVEIGTIAETEPGKISHLISTRTFAQCARITASKPQSLANVHAAHWFYEAQALF